IGAARYIKTELPSKTFAVLEARGACGGTWDLFRYPGVRSDSDLHTYAYEFKPWKEKEAIASAPRILEYLRETVAENGLGPAIRYHHKVIRAAWSSSDARWIVDIERTDTGEPGQLTATWLFCAGGYYRYDEGFTPRFEGQERFRGPIVHPQKWPEDLDYAGKRVLVIGSGATAVTLVPAMAATARHVTMLQRTPTYILPFPKRDKIANALTSVLGHERGSALARRKNILRQRTVWRFCHARPRAARRLIRRVNAGRLPAGYPVDEHFNPPYDPWEQRLCVVPDGDLFKAIRRGRASVVTDHIAAFTEHGVRLESGRELPADVVVTATGLNLQPFGGIELTVDGEPVHLNDTVSYKGMMLSGVPNFAYAMGYLNSSWTLKVGLLCEHFCRLLAHMDAHGDTVCRPGRPDPAMPTGPFLDFAAGYIQRALHRLPRQGTRTPWQTPMEYAADVRLLRDGSVVGPELRFSGPAVPAAPSEASEDRFVDLPSGPRICYRIDGPQDGTPLLLIAGLGQDLTSWPQRLVDGFTANGFRVIRFDNRDVGRSSRIQAPPPDRLHLLLGRPRPDAYHIADMAADACGLLDHLAIERAHLVGMSMGGMIAQTIAALDPDRVATLTSVFSTTGQRRVGQPALSTTLLRVISRPARTREQAVERHLALLRHIGSDVFPPDGAVERAWAAGKWDRGDGPTAPAGTARQLGAIQASGDRTEQLRRITAPTLVVHGDADRVVHHSGGRATAAAIRGARHVEVAGMGHHLAPGVIDRLVALTADLARTGPPVTSGSRTRTPV
ncbi:alpha/beta fold hydrolase, partial [Streptomyces sp. NPDC059564]|uniref:alpha/beta fold hydrolase n=1 Tax=Streptomyces sp. NPDC059564 TaxID=3346865 RepID=UPI0036928AC9